MSWFDRAAARIAPTWALKRVVARQRLDRLRKGSGRKTRAFDAVSGDRLRYDFLSTSASPDSAIRDTAGTLRQHVRHMELNTGYISGPIQRVVDHVVGSGIRFQARAKETERDEGGALGITQAQAERFNRRVERAFRIWMRQADVRLIHTFFEHQRLVEGALLRDGEVLVVGRDSKRPGRGIPYCQEVLEIDRLRTPAGELTNPKIRNGVEYDDEGVPKAYYLLKVHPGETLMAFFKASDFEEVPAWNQNGTRRVFHLFNPIRPEQLRGFSQFAAALKDLQDHDRYFEAEVMAMLEDACLTGFVKTEDPETFQQGYTSDNLDLEAGDGGTGRIHEFAPNKWHYLAPGQDVHIHSPSRPNQAFAEISEQLLRGPSSALNVPPEILSQNWKGMNYSNARTVILQFMRSCLVRYLYLVEHYCIPTYECVLSDLVAHRKVEAQGFAQLREEYLASEWIPTGWPWVDPVKEAQGKEIGLRNGFETLTGILGGRGNDLDEFLETRAVELKKMAELEEKHGIVFPASMKGEGPATPVAPEPPDDEGAQGSAEDRNLRLVQGEDHAGA